MKLFHITLSVLKNTFGKDITTQASINCLDWGFIKWHKLLCHCLPKPIHAKNIDGSYNKAGIIKFIITMFIQIEGIIHRVLFHIISCGNENVILGIPWLERINPLIDWAKCMINIQNHTDKTPDYNRKNEIVQGTTTTAPIHPNLLPKEFVREKPIYPDENFINFLQGESITLVVNKFKKENRIFTAVKVCKTTITTELAKEAGTSEVRLPEQYQEFSSVFSEEEAHCFPLSRSCDCHQP